MRRLAQGHLDTPLGGAGDRTRNLQVTIRPALPPVPHAAAATSLWLCEHQTVFVKYCSALWEEDLKVAVDQPVGLEVVIVFSERVDQLLCHLHNGRLELPSGQGGSMHIFDQKLRQ